MQRLIITDTVALEEFCQACMQEQYISIDTEFVREHTYYPKLCLVQISLQEKAALIDPLASGIDLKPLYHLLRAPHVLKVFHAARQDLEIFYHLMGEVVHPVYDSQIAAMALGVEDQISYHALVKQWLEIELDKGSRMTQWDKRPLSDAQKKYAFLDVEPLHRLYPMQKAALQQREEWIVEQHAKLVDASNLFVLPENAWQLLKLRHLKPKQLGALQVIAAWREKIAQSLNLPRRWVLSDDSIITLVQNQPKNLQESNKLRLKPKNPPQFDSLLQDLQQVEPVTPAAVSKRPPPNPNLFDMLRLAMHGCTREHHVAVRLLCTLDQLQDLSRLEPCSAAWKAHPLQQGWRRRVFGEVAEKIACGQLALRYENQKLHWVSLAEVSTL